MSALGLAPLRAGRARQLATIYSRPASVGSMEMWNVIVWNDEVNLAAHVSYVFRRLIGLDRDDATALMLEIHRTGSATVARGAREHVELMCFRLRTHGLDATLEPT